ncbi:MAG: hypothetical protein WCL39_08445 [Armatimonadota bacterium]
MRKIFVTVLSLLCVSGPLYAWHPLYLVDVGSNVPEWWQRAELRSQNSLGESLLIEPATFDEIGSPLSDQYLVKLSTGGEREVVATLRGGIPWVFGLAGLNKNGKVVYTKVLGDEGGAADLYINDRQIDWGTQIFNVTLSDNGLCQYYNNNVNRQPPIQGTFLWWDEPVTLPMLLPTDYRPSLQFGAIDQIGRILLFEPGVGYFVAVPEPSCGLILLTGLIGCSRLFRVSRVKASRIA